MAKILILDDDKDYCEEIELALSSDNHTIFTAESGAEAIKICIAERPDILVTDWMLRESLDGLSVAEIMEVLQANLQVILITGFASGDLKIDATKQEVFDLLEKPFRGEEIRRVVDNALRVSKLNPQMLPIGAIEVTDGNEISYVNTYAKKLLFDKGIAIRGKKLEQVFGPDASRLLMNAHTDWTPVETRNKNHKLLSVRTRRIDEHRELLIFLTAENSSYMFEPLVHELLDSRPKRQQELSINGHLLVIDDFPQIRRVAAAILKDLNCICHTARSQEEALDLFDKDKNIQYVIIDLEMNRSTCQEFIKKLRSKRERLKIIGSCSVYGSDIAELKVDAFLPKPWSDEELYSILQHSSGFHQSKRTLVALPTPRNQPGPFSRKNSNEH